MAAGGTNVGLDFTYAAGASFATKQYLFAVHSTAADRTALVASAAVGETVIGIIQDKAGSGEASEIRTGGRSAVVYGGGITRGDKLTCDAAGKAVKYTKATVFTGTPYIVSGTPVYAVAEESGVASDVRQVLLSFRGLDG